MRFRAIVLGTGLLATAAALPAAGPARAEDDQPFLTLHTTELEEAGEAELETWLAFQSGHAHEAFAAFENRNELEYGLTDDLQGSLYLNYAWSRARAHSPLDPAEVTNDVSVSGELVWRALDADSAPLGLAFYLEPAIGSQARSIEAKILLQKNFLGDRLRTVINIVAQDEWDHDPAGVWTGQSALEFDGGAAWRLSPAWSIALEFDNERGYDGEVLGPDARPVSSSFYLGPTLQYTADPFEVTFGVQAQLPIAANSAHAPGAVVDGFTADDERCRFMLRLTSDL